MSDDLDRAGVCVVAGMIAPDIRTALDAMACIEAQAAEIAELEAALKMSEQRFATLKNAWDQMRRRNVPIYVGAALGGKDE